MCSYLYMLAGNTLEFIKLKLTGKDIENIVLAQEMLKTTPVLIETYL